MLRTKYILLLLTSLFTCAMSQAQTSESELTVSGIVHGTDGETLPGASVYILENSQLGSFSDENGLFTIKLPHKGPWTLKCSMVGYSTEEYSIELGATNRAIVNFVLENTIKIGEAEVIGDGKTDVTIRRIDPQIAGRIPSPRGTIEDVLLQAPVNFTSELSSSYNVRGGSFDENLVYVNDIEVYRPFLVRSGQQEGLSFPNPDMVHRINFSAGGFESKYGDKMSSVLDIHYRKPIKRSTQATVSLMGAQIQHDDLSANGKFRINTGIRYRNNSYVLGSLDESGEYKPSYLDAQTYITWDPDGYGPWEVQLLGVYGENDYQFTPQKRETDVGTINEALRLTIYFNGMEKTSYQTGFGALAIERVTENSRLRWISSAFRTVETESFDILGYYRLDDLELDPGSDDFGEAAGNLGIGGFLNHARNQLEATVISTAIKGSVNLEKSGHFFEYGIKVQTEFIFDELSEWSFVDSADFISPHPQDSVGFTDPSAQDFQPLTINNLLKASNEVRSNRITCYTQDTWTITTGKGTYRPLVPIILTRIL
jgi:hypothetical protein